MVRTPIIIALICTVAFAHAGHCAVGAIFGVDDAFWDGYALIVGEVTKVDKEGDDTVVAVQTVAVIGTHHLVKNSMVLPYRAGLNSSLIGFNPKPGEQYVLFLQLIRERWWVTSDLVLFTGENQSGARLVKGVDDPMVDAIAKRVDACYAKWRREHDAKKP